jgi:uncharacterized protein
MKKASSDLLLLDVSVLIALAWPNHQLNSVARRRFLSSTERWATCAITQLGFIRLSSNPAAVSPAKRPRDAVRLLASMIHDSRHVYLEALPPPIDPPSRTFEHVLGPNQVTDAYLLQIARAHEAVLVTLDKRLRALAPTPQDIEILES